MIEGYINIYATAVLQGDQQLEGATKQKMNELSPGFFEQEEILLRFISLYKRADRQDQVIESFEELSSLRPDKIEYVSNLAIYYAQLGQNSQAEEVLRRLEGIDDELDKQIELLIERIYKGEFKK